MPDNTFLNRLQWMFCGLGLSCMFLTGYYVKNNLKSITIFFDTLRSDIIGGITIGTTILIASEPNILIHATSQTAQHGKHQQSTLEIRTHRKGNVHFVFGRMHNDRLEASYANGLQQSNERFVDVGKRIDSLGSALRIDVRMS